MGVRQYIGARYVPKIMGEWDNTIEYEPLSVVSDGVGNSYISRKKVPAGTLVSNTEYWMVSANYSQQVGSLSERMTTAEQNIQTQGQAISSMSPIVTDLSGRMQTAEQTIQSQGETLQDVAAEVLFSERKFIFQGDSYLMQSPSWGDLLASYLGLSSTKFRKLAASGAGFMVRGSSTNMNFAEQLNTVTDTDITDVVVAAGANDRAQLANNIKVAVADYIRLAKTKFGDNVKVWVAMCANSKTAGTTIWNACFDAFRLGAAEGGATFISDAAFALCAYSDFIDYLHPSAAGSANIAMAIANAIRGVGSFTYSKTQTGTGTLVLGTYDGGINARSIGNNDLVQYWLLPSSGTLDVRLESGIPLPARTYTDFIQLPDEVLFATGGVTYGQCIARIRDSSQNYITIDCKLRLTDTGMLQISPAEAITGADIIRCGNIFIITPARRAL